MLALPFVSCTNSSSACNDILLSHSPHLVSMCCHVHCHAPILAFHPLYKPFSTEHGFWIFKMEKEVKKKEGWVIAVCFYSFNLHLKFLCIWVTWGKINLHNTWQDQHWPMVYFSPLGTDSECVIINTDQYTVCQTWIQYNQHTGSSHFLVAVMNKYEAIVEWWLQGKKLDTLSAMDSTGIQPQPLT
jgi:hypothetical protein